MHILRTINLTLLIFVFLAPCKLGHLTLEDYQIWSVKSALANEFLNLLFQVGTSHDAVVQVVLMLKYLGFFFTSFCICLVSGLPHSPGPQAWHPWRRGANHQVQARPHSVPRCRLRLWRKTDPPNVLPFSSVCRGWLERESRHGLQQGQNWFLISMLWWQQWKDYVKYVSRVTNHETCYLLPGTLLQKFFKFRTNIHPD